jgi:nitroreductase
MELTPGLDMPLEEAMLTQRAVRRLKPDPVDDALLRRLLELALKAPTGSNAQNWEFIVVRDRAVKAKLGVINRSAFNLYGRLGRQANRDNPKMLRVIEAVQWQADHFEEIPVLVVACLKGMRLPFPSIAATSFYGSIYPSVQNFLLAARAVGLGAALITLPLWNSFAARRAERDPLRRDPCGLAHRPLRPHDPPSYRGRGLHRPLWQPGLEGWSLKPTSQEARSTWTRGWPRF